jgi:hypothetical protein
MRKITFGAFAILITLAVVPAQAAGQKYKYPNGSPQARQSCVKAGMAKGYDAAKANSWCAANNDGRN